MISFPTTPINGQIFSTDQYDYIWNESTQKWLQKQSNPSLKHRLLSDSASINLDLSAHSSFEVNIKGQSASPEISFSNPPAESGKFTVKVKNDYDLPKTIMNYSGKSHNELTPIGGNDTQSTSGIAFSTDGTRMFMGDATTAYLYQFDLTTPWDIQSRVYNGVRSRLGATVTTPVNVTFSHDGKHYFIMRSDIMYLYRVDLSTPWDLSTASYNGVFLDLGATVGLSDSSSFSQVQFNINAENPGNKMFFILHNYLIYEVEFLVPYDLPNAVYSGITANLRTVTGIDNGIFRGFTLNSDGSRILLADLQLDRILQINTQAPYTIAGSLTFEANFFDVDNTGESTPYGIYLKPDETKLFMIGPGLDSVHEIDIADNWTDPSYFSYAGNYVRFYNTAPGTFESAHFSPDGKTLLILTSTNSVIYQFDLRIPWDIDSMVFANKLFDFQSIQSTAEGLYVSPDGTHLFTVAGLDDQIEYFQMVTPWDVATLVHISSTNYTSLPSGTADQRSVWFTPDGSRMFLSRVSDIKWWDLSTPWDISTATYVSAKTFSEYTEVISGTIGDVEEIAFSERGDKLYFLETDADTILSVELSTPWDPSTGTIAVETVKHVAEASISYGFALSRDSDKIFLLSGADNNTIFEYESIYQNEVLIENGVSLTDTGSIDDRDSKIFITFKPDGTRVWYGDRLDRIYQAELTTPWDLSTLQTSITITETAFTGTGTGKPTALEFSSDGKKAYMLKHNFTNNALLYEIILTNNWDITSVDSRTSTVVRTYAGAMAIADNGTKIAISGQYTQRDIIDLYEMESFDLSTATIIDTYDTNAGSLVDLFFNSDGSELYTCITGAETTSFTKFTLGTSFIPSSTTGSTTFTLPIPYLTNFYIDDNYYSMYVVTNTSGAHEVITEYTIQDVQYSIQWPDNVNWENDTAPETPKLNHSSVIDFYTADGGTTYSGIERVSSAYNPNNF